MSEHRKEEVNGCPVCGGNNIRLLIEINNMPVHSNLLWSAKEHAVQTPKGDIHLNYCKNCGHIYNESLDPAKLDYSDDYENALYFSPTFQNYIEKLADYLIKKYHLRNKKIIDIGCGQGYFLSRLCRNSTNQGYGFDPSFRLKEQDLEHPENVSFIQDYYSERYVGYEADLIVCRQVLEHIMEPSEFIKLVKNALKNEDSVVFFEVPNAGYMLKNLSFWDIIYEHKSYFSKKSLDTLFSGNAFSVNQVYDLFDRQYIGLEAGPSDKKKKEHTHIGENIPDEMIENFEKKFKDKVTYWKSILKRWTDKREKISLWGAGSKGMTFLNIIKPTDSIEYVVDVNPRKQGKYLNGGGQEIMPPEFLKTYQPDHILLMNPVYEKEIRKMISGYGIKTHIEIV